MKLLAELQRRNVIRMAGLYLNGAWLVTQALQANGLLDEAMTVTKRARPRFPDDQIVPGYWAALKLERDQDITALLAQGDVGDHYFRVLVDIARYVHGDIDALTRPIAVAGSCRVPR